MTIPMIMPRAASIMAPDPGRIDRRAIPETHNRRLPVNSCGRPIDGRRDSAYTHRRCAYGKDDQGISIVSERASSRHGRRARGAQSVVAARAPNREGPHRGTLPSGAESEFASVHSFLQRSNAKGGAARSAFRRARLFRDHIPGRRRRQ